MSGELLICHLSIHIISFECPLQKKKKRKKKKEKKPKEKEREKRGCFVIVRSLQVVRCAFVCVQARVSSTV